MENLKKMVSEMEIIERDKSPKKNPLPQIPDLYSKITEIKKKKSLEGFKSRF